MNRMTYRPTRSHQYNEDMNNALTTALRNIADSDEYTLQQRITARYILDMLP